MKKYIIYTLGFIGLLFSACEDVIEVKLNEEDIDLYAVEAKITTQDKPYVYLYKGMKVNNDRAFTGTSNAIVTISDGQTPPNSMVLEESDTQKGLYLVPEGVDYIGIANREYTVNIEVDGTTITATEFLSPVEPIDSMQVRASLRGNKRFLGIFTYGAETPGLGDYYKWDIFVNDTLLYDSEHIVVASDELVDGNYINGLEIFTDFHEPDEEDKRLIKYLDRVQVYQLSISEFAYNYFSQLYEQGETGFLFSVPPANIKGNFSSSGGKEVLGLFTAHDVSVSNVVLIDDSIESQLD